ncbi:uncharacterized protein mansc4 [Festucalex cinctus]
MNVARGLLTLMLVACGAEARCSPTSYYKNCWIRSFPGMAVDTGASERRGGRLLRTYREESALRCSRGCCLAANASCNVAVFHYVAAQDNCCHLHCPTLESCIISYNNDAVLYNVTKGVDPDLLVFGKHLTPNVRVGRVNASELLPLDKRQFFHPPPPVATVKTSAAGTPKTTTKTSTVTPKLLSSSVTTFQTSVPPPSTDLVPYHAPTPPTFTSTIATTHPLTPSNDPSTLSSFKLRDANGSSPQMSAKEQETNDLSIPTWLKDEPNTQTSFQDPQTDLASTQSSSKERDTNKPKTQTSVQERGSTPGGEDSLADSGPEYQGLPAVLVTCAAVLLGCFVWRLARWRAKKKRTECYRTSGRRGTMRLIKYDPVAEGDDN